MPSNIQRRACDIRKQTANRSVDMRLAVTPHGIDSSATSGATARASCPRETPDGPVHGLANHGRLPDVLHSHQYHISVVSTFFY